MTDVNIRTTCFCLIFISSGSGCSGFTSIEIDRSINRSVAIIAPHTLTTNSDLELFSPVTFSDEDISIFRGYYCTYQLAERPVRHGIICEKSGKRASKTLKLFQNKNKSAQSTLGDTGSLNYGISFADAKWAQIRRFEERTKLFSEARFKPTTASLKKLLLLKTSRTRKPTIAQNSRPDSQNWNKHSPKSHWRDACAVVLRLCFDLLIWINKHKIKWTEKSFLKKFIRKPI